MEINGDDHSLNMESDLQCLSGLLCTAVRTGLEPWMKEVLRARNSPLPHPPPASGLLYEGAIG
jgi:hypothetical protein